MGIKIKREPFLKIEKAYRITTVAVFFAVSAIILSAVVVVPIFGSSTAYGIMTFYSSAFFGYFLSLLVCAVLGGLAFSKTTKASLGIHCLLHALNALLVIVNYKLFIALFLYGIKNDSAAASFIGSDTDAFVGESAEKWIYLITALIIHFVLTVFSIVKLSKEKRS